MFIVHSVSCLCLIQSCWHGRTKRCFNSKLMYVLAINEFDSSKMNWQIKGLMYFHEVNVKSHSKCNEFVMPEQEFRELSSDLGTENIRCPEYESDFSKPKIYQTFDVPVYFAFVCFLNYSKLETHKIAVEKEFERNSTVFIAS